MPFVNTQEKKLSLQKKCLSKKRNIVISKTIAKCLIPENKVKQTNKKSVED